MSISSMSRRDFLGRASVVLISGSALIGYASGQDAKYVDSVPTGRTPGGALDMRGFKTHGICPRWVNRVLILMVAFAFDFRFERGCGEIDAGNAAVLALGRPAKATAVGRREFVLLLAGRFDKLRFQRFEPFGLLRDFAVKADCFGDEILNFRDHWVPNFRTVNSTFHVPSTAPAIAFFVWPANATVMASPGAVQPQTGTG